MWLSNLCWWLMLPLEAIKSPVHAVLKTESRVILLTRTSNPNSSLLFTLLTKINQKILQMGTWNYQSIYIYNAYVLIKTHKNICWNIWSNKSRKTELVKAQVRWVTLYLMVHAKKNRFHKVHFACSHDSDKQFDKVFKQESKFKASTIFTQLCSLKILRQSKTRGRDIWD